MGKMLKYTQVKVDKAPGELGKGTPLIKVAGQGGLFNLSRSKPIHPNTQIPGFKSLLQKGIAIGKVRKPPGFIV